MPIQLDKILENIAKERVLHPCNAGNASKREVDDAWARVGRNNKLSVHESRSIFKVLQKKYEQEKIKSSSAWKLFGLMQQIHQAAEPKATPSAKEDEEPLPIDEVEEYEMLEVQEPEEEDDEEGTTTAFIQPGPANSTGSASDGESPTKSMHSSTGSPDKDDKPFVKTIVGTPRPHQVEEKKVLNSMARGSTLSSTTANALTAAALQRKGITLKKATSVASSTKISGGVASLLSNKQSSHQQRNNTIQLPESLKRKLSEDLPGTPSHTANKKSNIGIGGTGDKHSPKTTNSAAASSSAIVHTTTTAQLMQLKKDRDGITYTPPSGINIITVPAAGATVTRADLANGGGGDGASSSTAATVASTSTNGFSPNLQDINFNSGDIIFESSGINGTTTTTTLVGGDKNKPGINNTTEVINLGNFDNSLPPTFFKNLCVSSRHEALGLYVSNIMNRLSTRNAAKLEISIVRAILDAQSEELED